jgi:hypothetical protein
MREQLTIEVLEALVGFDTTSRNSNLALVEWVEVYLDRLGLAHERVPDKTGGKANVWATIGPSGVPGTILSGLSFPKIPSERIRAMRENQSIIRRDACHPPSPWDICRRPVQVAAPA